jgi:hypothetical protein
MYYLRNVGCRWVKGRRYDRICVKKFWTFENICCAVGDVSDRAMIAAGDAFGGAGASDNGHSRLSPDRYARLIGFGYDGRRTLIDCERS